MVNRATATLTMREREEPTERIRCRRVEWDHGKAEMKDGRSSSTPSNEHLYIKEGFKTGWIYEFIYDTEGSRVMNLGFLGIRDLLSMLRFDERTASATLNPLAGHIDKVYGTGASLSARDRSTFTRAGTRTTRTVACSTACARTGSGRCSEPALRPGGRYPRQLRSTPGPPRSPFTFIPVPDPFTAQRGHLARPRRTRWSSTPTPKGDYWTRHVSLTHGPRDASDVEIPAYARMYQFTGAPHMVRALDDPLWIGQLTPNAISAVPYRRAVLTLLDKWATDGTPPPASLLPKTGDGTLVTADEVLAKYPKLKGVNLPKSNSKLPRYNYGPDFDKRGVMSVFPPEPVANQEYPLRVPAIDADGNSIAGLRYPDIEVPLGTYNGWSLRRAGYSEGEQWWNTGSFVPFARTRSERAANDDPRPSIEERYASHEAYVALVDDVSKKRLAEVLLQEDADRFMEAARDRNPLDPSVRLAPLVQAGAYTGR